MFLADPEHLMNSDRCLHHHVIFAGTMASCLGNFCEVRPSTQYYRSQTNNCATTDLPIPRDRWRERNAWMRSRVAGPHIWSHKVGLIQILYHSFFSFLIILLRFLEVNPGQQLITGSFNPISSGDWAIEAYQIATLHVADWVFQLHAIAFLINKSKPWGGCFTTDMRH